MILFVTNVNSLFRYKFKQQYSITPPQKIIIWEKWEFLRLDKPKYQ